MAEETLAQELKRLRAQNVQLETHLEKARKWLFYTSGYLTGQILDEIKKENRQKVKDSLRAELEELDNFIEELYPE